MSSGEPRLGRGTGLMIVYATTGVVGSLVVFLYLMLGAAPPSTQPTTETEQRPGDNALEEARKALARDADLSTCRSVLQQVNTYLAHHPAQHSPGADRRSEPTGKLFHLDEGELAEVEGKSYTPLDAHHLEMCLLLHDVAHSLEVRVPAARPGGQPVRPGPLEQAETAFNWVVRQVRQEGEGGPRVPPLFALRRGSGTALERALVYLALLEQVGWGEETSHAPLLGCLVFCPDQGGTPRFWACGVVVGEGKDVYLFDPRLGLPLPGPAGRGVATLAQAAADPGVLGQLTVKPEHGYDVTAEQARQAQVYLVCPLSALAPRLRVLQDDILPPAVRVHLATDPAKDLERLRAAVAGTGKGVAGVWKEGTGLLRNFLPRDEGGADDPKAHPFALRQLRGFTTPDDPTVVQMSRRQQFLMELVPWSAYPALLRDPRSFRFDVGLGERLHDLFADPFLRAATAPGGPRDLVVRGRTRKAVSELTQEYSRWQRARSRLATAQDLDRGVAEWVQRAVHAYADLLRAQRGGGPEGLANARRQVEEVWKHAEPVQVLLQGSIADPRGAEVVYQLGLCKQEWAEAQQARLELLRRAHRATPTDEDKTRAGWRDALDWWKEYVEEHKGAPGHAAARRLRGRAQALLGDRQAGVASLEDLSGPLTEPEKAAHLYLAQSISRNAQAQNGTRRNAD